MTTAWVVRAGRGGAQDEVALRLNRVIIGWDGVGDLTGQTPEQIESQLRNADRTAGNRSIGQSRGQLLSFRDRVQVGDIVVVPLSRRAYVAIGVIAGNYAYDMTSADFPHFRPVNWLTREVLRSDLPDAIRRSLSTKTTVFRINREDAAEQLVAIAQGRQLDERIEAEPDEPEIELESYASLQIQSHIKERFKEHELTYLVEDILRAQGFVTDSAKQTKDGGVDILAGRGLLGFDPPCICVQVKSGGGKTPEHEIRALIGVMENFGASHGLFVAVGGFTSDALNLGRQKHFKLRLWTLEDVVDALQHHYEDLSDSAQAKLPLKQVWTLAD